MFTNDLIHETSPYLLQHAHNPVQWKAWNAQTLGLAKEQNKLMLISIGYAACHWCHVMEKECFEDIEVAELMNEHFICIKVDREERPDVDQVYMTAAQLINGNGGWPLNALALPDGKPFFAATYFPKNRWIQLLRYFIDQYKNNRSELFIQADHLSKGIRDADHIPFEENPHGFSSMDIGTVFRRLMRQVDRLEGGLSGNIKFPMPALWEAMLVYHKLSGDNQSLELTELTLKKMAVGGIYDHLGGGFSRYSTDPKWHIPHFEKMLYDNAQLVSLYSHAFQITRKNIYREIAEDTIRFIRNELSKDEQFLSSIDADSEGEEGKFYAWTYDQIKEILREDISLFTDHFHVTKEGNWEEGKNILIRNADEFETSATTLTDLIRESREKLLKQRNKRVHPATDNKVITAWNAMMCKALIDAGNAFESKEYLLMAKHTLDFLIHKMWDNERGLFRNYQNHTPSTHAFLDDYAYLIHALIYYYQSTLQTGYLMKARELTAYVLKHFHDESQSMFYYVNLQYSSLISRPMEMMDNVIPSSNAVMAENLHHLGVLFDDETMKQQSENMLNHIMSTAISSPAYFSFWIRLVTIIAHHPREVVIMGKDCIGYLNHLRLNFLPNCITCGSEEKETLPLMKDRFQKNETLIYVCFNNTCQKPVASVKEAERFINHPVTE